jgi:hypothetical protein
MLIFLNFLNRLIICTYISYHMYSILRVSTNRIVFMGLCEEIYQLPRIRNAILQLLNEMFEFDKSTLSHENKILFVDRKHRIKRRKQHDDAFVRINLVPFPLNFSTRRRRRASHSELAKQLTFILASCREFSFALWNPRKLARIRRLNDMRAHARAKWIMSVMSLRMYRQR